MRCFTKKGRYTVDGLVPGETCRCAGRALDGATILVPGCTICSAWQKLLHVLLLNWFIGIEKGNEKGTIKGFLEAFRKNHDSGLLKLERRSQRQMGRWLVGVNGARARAHHGRPVAMGSDTSYVGKPFSLRQPHRSDVQVNLDLVT